MVHLEFHSLTDLEAHLAKRRSLAGAVLVSLDLRRLTGPLIASDVRGAIFLGCRLAAETIEVSLNRGALIFPPIDDMPFDAYRTRLYRPEELMAGYQVGDEASYEETLDGRIYRHYLDGNASEPRSLLVTLARRLHDHSISDALDDFVAGQRVVAIMGGHSTGRDEPEYRSVARIARLLARRGYLMTSGGGPGSMEATHLGACFAHRDEEELVEAIDQLSVAPLFEPLGPWLDSAFDVVARHGFGDADDRPISLGIPTWHYGHEPPNAFATDIAKYFANSVREEGLLSIARYGVIYAPGSMGTIQEVFQDAAQNHYGSVGAISPMIFLGRRYWTETKPVYPLLEQLAADRPYGDLLALVDDAQGVVDLVQREALIDPGTDEGV